LIQCVQKFWSGSEIGPFLRFLEGNFNFVGQKSILKNCLFSSPFGLVLSHFNNTISTVFISAATQADVLRNFLSASLQHQTNINSSQAPGNSTANNISIISSSNPTQVKTEDLTQHHQFHIKDE